MVLPFFAARPQQLSGQGGKHEALGLPFATINQNDVIYASIRRRVEMRADELDHEELLELDPEGGVIRFAGQRALLLDAVAMGLLRKYLVENFGLTAARTVLTQFGFAHGWRMAEAMQTEFKWDSDDDWRRAGARIHTLEGLFRVLPGSKGPLSKEGSMFADSYEA